MAYPRWLPLLLGFLTAVGPLSTDMYLPAFPSLEQSFCVPPGSAQITLATWFFGLAIGQLTQGSLADRFGRRRPFAIATVLYTVSSVGCALAPNLLTLAVLRFIMAIGGSASMVIPRAIVRDVADGHAAARLMSRLMLVMGVAPIVAPTLGGLILLVAPWRAIFWIGAAYGAISFVLVWRLLPETLATQHRVRLGLAGLLSRYGLVLKDKVFLAYMAIGSGGMFGMFAYIGGSSPVLIEQFGFSPAQYGMLFGASAGCLIGASQFAPLLLPRFGASRILRAASLVYLLAAIALTACAMSRFGGPAGVVVPVMVVMGTMGIIMPSATVSALSRHAAQAGSASAVMGTATFCLAAVSGELAGLLNDGTPRPMAALILAGAVAVITADRLRPKSRDAC